MRRILFVFTLSFFVLSCNQDNGKETINEGEKSAVDIFCGAEEIDVDGKYFISSNGYRISNVNTQSEEDVRTGKYSIKVNKDHQFGFTIDLEDIKDGEYFVVDVWRKGNKSNALVAQSVDSKMLYRIQKKVLRTENGWDLLRLKIIIPPSTGISKLRFYVYNINDEPACFDDFKISRYAKKPEFEFNKEALSVSIDSVQYNKIVAKRNKAILRGIIEKADDDWVKAKISYMGDTSKVKLRIKGDWLDHVRGVKWSFRIKTKKSSLYWNGMRTFSIQTPEVRGYLREWVYHKLLKNEDLLTTRYGFIPVEINGVSKGIYAYEEHFEKQLLESSNRREGPILKFSEDEMFKLNVIQTEKGQGKELPIIESSSILTFGENKMLSDPNRYKMFIKARDLLYQLKWDLIDVEDVYDLDKVAKYYAIVDVTRSYHSATWHNLRYYYNPITTKFEIIGFDGNYDIDGASDWVNSAILGNIDIDKVNDCSLFHYNYKLFKNRKFQKYYIKYLKKFSSEEYIENLYNEIYEESNILAEMISLEDEYYTLDTNYLRQYSQRIINELSQYEERVNSGYFDEMKHPLSVKEYSKGYGVEMQNLLVKAFKENNNKIKIYNYNSNDIDVIGFGDTHESMSVELKKPIKISARTNFKRNDGTSVRVDTFKEYLFYKTPDKEIGFIKIHKWEAPSVKYSKPYSVAKNDLKTNSIFKVKSDVIIFNRGVHIIKEDIFLPSNYSVQIPEGVELDFINNSSFVSYSELKINGTSAKPVKIYSSDGSSNGFNVLMTKNKSELNFVEFDQLNSMRTNNWNLTGAVNFYESDVDFNNCTFKNNRSEDALNVIRSHFNMNNCSFDNVFADGFDADFCTGIVKNSKFRDISNDAIDFSGSKVTITKCSIGRALDKGISGGEASTLTINDCDISNTNIGIASKDKSIVNVNDTKIFNTNYGFVAFTKKNEYGPAKLVIKNTSVDNYKTYHLIELRSTIVIDGEEITGTEEKVSKLFYL